MREAWLTYVWNAPAVLPLYLNGPRVANSRGVTFGKFTMSNLELGSQLYWCTSPGSSDMRGC